ncbi:hypothetical protein [Synechocystis sp. PCC 7509]|uniref:hypothetical protein n=1 Tax=Synechocystis sp. PCC 7509 TaxID=927677 RepID=UPI0002AC2831|nr:hypothetical protein [Synechocystis sp. PCC 7509]
MNWQPLATITTNEFYVYTPVVTGTLFKLKHVKTNPEIKALKIVIRQAFEEQGELSFFDYKLIGYKTELDIILLAAPTGLNNRKLAIKRVDNLLNEDWIIEIEQMSIVENGVNLPINISDVTNLQLQLDSIQAELTLKALDLDLDNHIDSSNNPHSVTALQVGADPIGSAIANVASHESTTNHPLASSNSAGMFSVDEKIKLSSVATGATVNEPDAYLLSRTNHQDTQAINTIDGLDTVLSSFVNLTGNQNIEGNKNFINLLQALGGIQSSKYNYNTAPLSLEITRTVPTVLNDFIEIGTLNNLANGMIFRISLCVSTTLFSLAKHYVVATVWRSSPSPWLRLIPDKSFQSQAANDCDLDLKISANLNNLRLRRTGSSFNVGTAKIRLELLSNSSANFVETFLTGNDPNVTGTR